MPGIEWLARDCAQYMGMCGLVVAWWERCRVGRHGGWHAANPSGKGGWNQGKRSGRGETSRSLCPIRALLIESSVCSVAGCKCPEMIGALCCGCLYTMTCWDPKVRGTPYNKSDRAHHMRAC